jgi:protoheme IX farnesyltransferase
MQFMRRSFVRLNSQLITQATRPSFSLARPFSNVPPSADKSTEGPSVASNSRQLDAESAPKKKFSTYKDLMMLTKFELSLLNTTVALAGYMLVPGVQFLSIQTLWFTSAVQLMAMTSQTVNQIKEKHHDSKMLRTCMRPIPRNRVSVGQASALALGMWGLSNAIFYSFFPINGLIVANSILFSYILLYTPMKRTSEYNTTVGSLVGALPPLLGWVSAGGSMLSLVPWNLVLFMFAWQFPHFYGILWTYRSDYDNQEYRMIKDHKKAALIMKSAIAAMGSAVAMLTTAGSFSPAGLGLMFYLLYSDSYRSVTRFEADPSVQNAKLLKRKAYMPFTIFFLVIILNIMGLTPEQLLKAYLAGKA